MPIKFFDQSGIKCFYQNQHMSFEFIQNSETCIMNELKQFLVSEEKHFNFLKIEVYSMDIYQKLQSSRLNSKKFEIEKDSKKQICSDHPNAFWNRK